MVELGRHDGGELLARLDAIADIDRARGDVAAGAGEDVGRGEGRGRGRQADDELAARRLHRGDAHLRHEAPPLLGVRRHVVLPSRA